MCQDITHEFIPSHSQTHKKNYVISKLELGRKRVKKIV